MADATKKDERAIDPNVARLFARKFPGVTLEFFSAVRRDNGKNMLSDSDDRHILTFMGPGDVLEKLGLVESYMLPAWPKRRKSDCDDGVERNESVGNWFTTWRTKKCLHVWRELTLATPHDHALADFGLSAWPIGETSAQRRARFLEEVGGIGRFMRGALESRLRVASENVPLADDLWELARPLFSRFETDLSEVLKGARLKQTPNRLELVVDNTRNRAPGDSALH